jgi:hypothetical protein
VIAAGTLNRSSGQISGQLSERGFMDPNAARLARIAPCLASRFVTTWSVHGAGGRVPSICVTYT